MPRANHARGKVRGALPRTPARGTPPETPGPLSLALQIAERSSPSRVRCAAQNRRALDCSGPFRTTHFDKGKGANAKATPGSSAVTKGDISIEALRGTFLSRLDTCPPSNLTCPPPVGYPEFFAVEARRPSVARLEFRWSFGSLSERGRLFFRRNRGGKLIPSGWGARLIPAHCHPFLRRVERYRE
jgi:hypothetical protein